MNLWNVLKISAMFVIGWDIISTGGSFGEMLATQGLIAITFKVIEYGMME